MLLADFEALLLARECNREVRHKRAKVLISDLVGADSADYSTANEWLCDGFERNSTLFLLENLHESMFILRCEFNKSAKKNNKKTNLICTQ